MSGEPELAVREWSEAQWRAAEPQWNALLARSAQDPLFLSWQWMIAWWRHFGAGEGRALRICAAYRGDELLGIAPLYCRAARRRMLPVRSLQFVGISWRDSDAVASPYLDFIAAAPDRPAVRAAILQHLAASDGWSELLVNNSSDPEAWERALGTTRIAPACYLRTIERSTSYQADLAGGFEAYLDWLGQSTRRSLWHLRRRLDAKGRVDIEQVAAADLDAGFGHLNRLHELRWGKPAFAADRLNFHLELARGLAARGELAMSLLRLEGRIVSVLYDVRKDARQYNLKMAFDPAVAPHFSLGLIHFGYAMELAARHGVTQYDFLAGPGQHADFKRHLAQQRQPLATVQMLKGPILRRLYRWHDARGK